MTQCPYKHELYRSDDKRITAGVYGNLLVGTGAVSAAHIMCYLKKIAESLNLTELDKYNVLKDKNGTTAVMLGDAKLTEAEMWQCLHTLYDQDLACMHCNMSRSMDEYHGKKPREVEKVTLGDNQIIAYGEVATLTPYDEAAANIVWYLDKTQGQGEAMLANIGYSGYEIVLAHIEIDGTHYEGDSEYISVADAERLVEEGLASYMELE